MINSDPTNFVNFRKIPGVLSVSFFLLLAGCRLPWMPDFAERDEAAGKNYAETSEMKVQKNLKKKLLGDVSSGFYHQVSKGETINQIAAKYGITAWALTQANQLGDGNRIEIGQKLYVPRTQSVNSRSEAGKIREFRGRPLAR